jgi:hypothetical protein
VPLQGLGPANYTADAICTWLKQCDLGVSSERQRTPARWVADDHQSTTHCPLSGYEFDWVRRKHHCRLCGGVFADDASSRRSMIPKDLIVYAPTEQESWFFDVNVRDPQRVCDPCCEALMPIQDILANTMSNAVQSLEHKPETEENTLMRFLNNPLGFSMETEIKKAANSVANFTSDGIIKDKSIPIPLLQASKGLVFMTVVKGGVIWCGKAGTGLVVARQRDGSWSAPSAVGMMGMSWGLQAGGEVRRVVRREKAPHQWQWCWHARA